MEHLPPVGWADVATKRDLDALEARMEVRFDARFDRVEERFATVDLQFQGIDRRFDEMDRRLEGMDRRLEDLPREFRSLLVSVMGVMAVLFATTMGGVVAAIKV